jgi:DNA sulfur modification protein DndB
MASVYSCIKGKFGPWEYYHITMPAADVATKLMIPKDMPGWEDLSLEEKFQRKLNKNRVNNQIVKYLTDNKWRFFGSLLVTVKNHQKMEFSEVKGFVNKDLGPLYKSASENMGFLHLDGKEMLIPIDGQHRYAAIKTAISGKSIDDKELKDFKANPGVEKDDVSMILIRHKSETRNIFNKVNRYAKPTTKGDNLITDDDDVVAIISREMCDYDQMLKGRLVSIEGTTLSSKSEEFTTLSTLYDNNLDILKENDHDINTAEYPGDKEKEFLKSEIIKVYNVLFKKVNLWKEALNNQDEEGDDIRRELREHYTILKPFGQRALVKAYLYLKLKYKKRDGSSFSDSDICNKFNDINWKLENEQWRGVMTKSGDRIESGKDNLQLASKLICHLCGAKIPEQEGFRDKYEKKAGRGLPKTI